MSPCTGRGLTDARDGVVRQLKNVQVLRPSQSMDARQFVVAQLEHSQTLHVLTVDKRDLVFLERNKSDAPYWSKEDTSAPSEICEIPLNVSNRAVKSSFRK